MFLEIRGIEKFFDRDNGVTAIDIDVEHGEFVTLLGPSGCGKTTILNLIGGFLKADRGTIVLEGEDITDLPPERRPVTTVFQSYALFPHMSVLQNIVYGLKIRRIPRAERIRRGEEMLGLVGLAPYRDRSIGQLSGGQQQRVALARALITNPKLLLLDEPLSNLDAKLRVKMREELKEIQNKFGVTMIFVTHDQEEALTVSDRIVALDRGRIRQIGTPEQIYTAPNDEFVADFIGRVNIVRHRGVRRAIRPENLLLKPYVPADATRNEAAAAALEEPDLFAGTIVKRQFLGAYRTYFIEPENRTQVLPGPIAGPDHAAAGAVMTGSQADAAAEAPHEKSALVQVDVPLREDAGWTVGDRVIVSFPV